jgi:hypothetical protein
MGALASPGAAMPLLKIVALTCLLAASAAAQAFGIGVRAGTTGVGADLGWKLAPTVSARLGYSGLKWDRDISTDDVSYDGKLKLSNLSGLLDFSPLGPFRLTGGLFYTHNRYALRGDPSGGSFTINGRTYAAGDIGNLSGTVKPGRRLAPYLGIGYGNVSGAGVNFYADLGILFQGSPKARLDTNCGPSLSPADCARLRSDVADEEARLEHKLKSFKYYPVLNIGLTVGF